MSASPWDPSNWGGGRNHWKRAVLLFKTQSVWRPCALCLVAPHLWHLGDLLQSWVLSHSQLRVTGESRGSIATCAY